MLYQITDVHRLNPDIESDEPYLEGIEIEILGAKVFSNITGESGDKKLIYGDVSVTEELGLTNDYSAESKELTVQALKADYVDGGFSTEYTTKLLEGNYIYEVIAKWSNSEDYGGTAHYSFYTVMGDYEPVSIQE